MDEFHKNTPLKSFEFCDILYFMAVERSYMGFNNESLKVEITPDQAELGRRTNELFTTRLIRPLPWDIKDGKITATQPFREAAFNSKLPGIDYVPGLYTKEILTDGLENEKISPELARTISLFKMVEDFLPDYMRRGTHEARNIAGLSRSYLQWGREELQHSLAAGLVLERTGNKTPEELMREYEENLTRTWEQPFPTLRQMSIYSYFQEGHTARAYIAVARRAEAEDAPITGSIFRLVAADESYHGAGYKEFVKIFYGVDPEGTKADVLHVAANYRMPALNLYPNPRQAFKDLLSVGAYDNDMVPQQVIGSGLKALGFVNENEIAQAVSPHLRKAK